MQMKNCKEGGKSNEQKLAQKRYENGEAWKSRQPSRRSSNRTASEKLSPYEFLTPRIVMHPTSGSSFNLKHTLILVALPSTVIEHSRRNARRSLLVAFCVNRFFSLFLEFHTSPESRIKTKNTAIRRYTIMLLPRTMH